MGKNDTPPVQKKQARVYQPTGSYSVRQHITRIKGENCGNHNELLIDRQTVRVGYSLCDFKWI